MGKIVLLLTTDFVKMVAIALLLAIPVGWWIMQHWLHNFAYRINVEWWVFAAAGILSIAVALLTISG